MQKWVFFTILTVFLVSCGSGEVKKVSPESKTTQEAFAVADILRDAYTGKDTKTLKENSTEKGYQELINSIKNFDSAELIFTPRWVEIEDKRVFLTVAWQGTWKIRGKTSNDRGVAILVFEGSPLRLERIVRENPFSKPE
jgi:hypothetical protein